MGGRWQGGEGLECGGGKVERVWSSVGGEWKECVTEWFDKSAFDRLEDVAESTRGNVEVKS